MSGLASSDALPAPARSATMVQKPQEETSMSQKSQSPKTTRRKLVLTGAAVAATAAISAPAA